MNDFFGKLIISNELLGLNWSKELVNQEDSDDSADGLLIPGSNVKILKKDLRN